MSENQVTTVDIRISNFRFRGRKVIREQLENLLVLCPSKTAISVGQKVFDSMERSARKRIQDLSDNPVFVFGPITLTRQKNQE